MREEILVIGSLVLLSFMVIYAIGEWARFLSA